jgi:hypothetical protein
MAGNRMSPYRREQVAAELRTRGTRGESITAILGWLGTTETTVGEAIELLEETLGYSRDAAERAIAEHPEWAKLVRLMGGMHGELLQDQPEF